MNASLPPIGVVIIGVNVERDVAACIRSVQQADYPSDRLVIVYVDGGSRDASPRAAAACEGVRVVELRDRHPTPGRGRNAGRRCLDTPLIHFLDANAEVHPAWFRRAAAALAPDVGAVCGNLRERDPGRSLFHRIADLRWRSQPAGDGCGDILVRRAALDAAGGFDEVSAAGGVTDFEYRMRRAGWRIEHIDAPMATRDIGRGGWRSYLKRAYRSGYACAETGLRYAHRPDTPALREMAAISLRATLPPAVLVLAVLAGMPGVGLLAAAAAALQPVAAAPAHRRRLGCSPAEAGLYALHRALVIFPRFAGVLRCLGGRLTHRPLRNRGIDPPAAADDVVALLGVPLDNVTLAEAVERILSMTVQFREDRRPRLVATVNVDFLVNSLAWFSRTPRHPELLDILRRADLVTADGMPVVWASRLLGTPLKGRVTGADLVPALAAAAAERGTRLYFLGGQADTGQRAADLLLRRYPGLQIAGVDSPYVHTVGHAIADAPEADIPVVDRINQAAADILFIGFGNPKQEVWFHRNRHRLQVPASIGIGGTFAFITGDVARAPIWMQRTGLEWIYRISQDPWRLWKRYGIGFFKFGVMFLPALAYDRVWRLWQRRRRGRRQTPAAAPLQQPGTMRVALPTAFDAAAVRQPFWETLKNESHPSPLILDFGKTRFVDSAGIGYLIGLWRRCETAARPLWLADVGADVRSALRVTRTLDLFGPRMVAGGAAVPAAAAGDVAADRLTVTVDRRADRVEVTLSGVLDAREAPGLTAQWAAETVGAAHCIAHVRGLTFVDSVGIMVFLRLLKQTGRHERRLVLCAPAPAVRRMLQVTKLDRLFLTAPDPAAAAARLEQSA